MKKYLFCSILALSLFWLGFYVWRFVGGYRTTASWQDDTETPQKPLREVVECALRRIISNKVKISKAKATLDFLGDELVDRMEAYGMSSNVERAHFLAQVMHESGDFTSTVESAGGDTWKDVAVFDAEASTWRCDGYLRAINSDKDFFDNDYKNSKDSYKATFRGRGLIQLTFCYNYMKFFYHFLSRQQNLTNLDVSTFTYSYGGEEGKMLIGVFCEKEELKSIAEGFRGDGLLVTEKFAVDFEDDVNRLSLPCDLDTENESSIPSQGEAFLVESSLWFWDEECRERHPDAIGDPSDRAVGAISGCVNGASELYKKFNEEWCDDGTPDADKMGDLLDEVVTEKAKNRRRDVLGRYCTRLHNFNVLMACS